jgi:S-adenosylmethionine:tRNA ribosyltransferase-isomerase
MVTRGKAPPGEIVLFHPALRHDPAPMRTSDFDFQFPERLIADHPLPRGEAKMLVVPRGGGPFRQVHARDLADFLAPGDILVLNDTKVLKARLVGANPLGQRCEALLLAPREPGNGGMRWEAMVKPAKRFRIGDRVAFSPRLEAEVVGLFDGGTRLLEFNLGPGDFQRELEAAGRIPLPPYIRREAEAGDEETYQSVFAERPGSVAAPTASLHLDRAHLERIAARGVAVAKLTLHVGAGTFKPVQSDDLEGHLMHAESYALPADCAEALNAARARGGRIWAVGTTVARVLETCVRKDGRFGAGAGETRIFIKPGHAWKAVDGLLTNFHWPRSTLFMLVCSLVGTERAREAYAEAFAREFRLFSYGDAMLITPE